MQKNAVYEYEFQYKGISENIDGKSGSCFTIGCRFIQFYQTSQIIKIRKMKIMSYFLLLN